MSTLFEQLSSSGGAERASTSRNSYHTPSTRASPTQSRWSSGSYNNMRNSRNAEYQKQREARTASYQKQRESVLSRRKPAQPQRQPEQVEVEIYSYGQVETSRPYAYEPARGQLEWVRPTWQDVLADLAWKILESAIAAAGMAIAEFFLHRRFHPGPGVRW